MIRLTLSSRSISSDAPQPAAATELEPAMESAVVVVESTAASEESDADERIVQSDTSQGASTFDCAESDSPDDSSHDDASKPSEMAAKRRRFSWRAAVAYVVLPVLAMLLAVGVGFLRWKDSTAHESDNARIESVQAATDSTIKMLSYKPESVEKDLASVSDRLTGSFRDAYSQLIHDVVIPGAKQKRISATATVPAAASVSASPSRAVVLVFVDQTIIVGDDAPSSTASSVRVALQKVGNRWLISDFTPV